MTWEEFLEKHPEKTCGPCEQRPDYADIDMECPFCSGTRKVVWVGLRNYPSTRLGKARAYVQVLEIAR